MLWVNLVMDTLAAIAFGSEPTKREFMEELGAELADCKLLDVTENIFMYNFISYSFYVISAVSLTLLGVLFINFVKKVSNKENVNAMV